jgi:two-component system, response regulator
VFASNQCVLTTILHVEDDLALRALVDISFMDFGFRGTIVTAGTVRRAIQRLEDASQGDRTFDLIICDVHLPDGTGLDVVRYVRASERWRVTPFLLLSSDVNPKLVRRAYALGANAYIDKAPAGRTISDVIRSLYDHWSGYALLPPARVPDRLHEIFTVAIKHRKRHARLYHRIAEKFADSRSESAFWLSRSLAESNLINVLGFIRTSCEAHDVPDAVLDELSRMQAASAAAVGAAERVVEQHSSSREVVYRHALAIVSQVDVDAIARTLGHLFPEHPAARDALRDFLLATIEDITAWIDLHTDDAMLRRNAAQIRSKIEPLAREAIAAHR